MDLERLLQHRTERDDFLKGHYASPLAEEFQAGFAGLEYFDPDPAWVIAGRFSPSDQQTIAIPSTAGTESDYKKLGEVIVEIAKQPYRLAVLDDGDGDMFLPFRDSTAGDTTYSGGRYVRPEIADDETATVDFNRASNPWCVYDAEFTCPLPPPSNIINAAVMAGERLWVPPV